MSDNNDVAEPRTRGKAAPRKSRRNFSALHADLESRIRYALRLLEGVAADNFQPRVEAAVDILKGV